MLQYLPILLIIPLVLLVLIVVPEPGTITLVSIKINVTAPILLLILVAVTILIPTLGPKGPQWGPADLICLSVFLYLCPSIFLRQFLANIRTSRNCAQRIWPQATVSAV